MVKVSDFTATPEGFGPELDNFNSMNQVPEIVDTPIIRTVSKLKATIEGARQEMQHSALSQAERGRLNSRIYDAAREELVRVIGAEKERLSEALGAERIRLERERALHRDALDRAAREAGVRFSAMTAQELERESLRILNSGQPVEPVILDLLSSELRSQAPQAHAFFREESAKARLYETERFTENGRKIARSLNTLNGYEDGQYVPVEHVDGSFSAVSLAQAIGEV